MLRYLTLILIAVGVVLALFAREIISIIAPDFDSAYRVVGLLVLAVAFWGISTVALVGIGLMRKTGFVALFTLVAVFLNVGLNFALIPQFGIVGASVANLAAYILLAFCYYVKSQQVYPTHYSLAAPAKTVVLGSLAMIVGGLPLPNSLPVFVLKLATVGAFVLALWILGVVDQAELRELRRLIGRERS